MKRKILFGITSLTLGGAERVLVDLANKLCEKYDITIFTIYAKGELENQLSDKIKLKTLYNNSYSELSNIDKHFIVPLKVLLLKKQIYNKKIKLDYDVEIAFLEGPITRLFSVKNEKTRKIAWIHNDISKVFGKNIKSKIKGKIDRKIYSKYETLVFVSKDNFKEFSKKYKDIRNKYLEPIKKEIIYNYIDEDKVKEKANMPINFKFEENYTNLLTVARLTKQKAIDRLIKIHKRLIDSGLKVRTYVIGDGPEKENLENMIDEFGVKESFYLLGKKENPYPYIAKADYFCLLSEFEGYGMVLEEAKILQKQIIITDTAAREAVQNYNASFILENEEEKIYEGLKEILSKKIKKETEEYKNDKNLENVIKLINKEEE